MDNQEMSQIAKKYLEDIISFFGSNVEVAATVVDDYIELSVPTSELNSILIGRNAETLRALQYVISTKLRNQHGGPGRVNIDIADYKKQRNEKLAEEARGWIENVRQTGDSYIAHLNASDRRVVHQVATEFEDIETFSEGEGRERTLTIAQKSS